MGQDEFRKCSMRTTESYRQIGKKSAYGGTYLHQPRMSFQQTIICHTFEDLLTEVQLRVHQTVTNTILRTILGVFFALIRELVVFLLLPISTVELLVTYLFAVFRDGGAFQAGLIAQVLFKHEARADDHTEWITISVEDSEAASALEFAELEVGDKLGWRYRFPNSVTVESITKLSRCWRMANDFRMTIIPIGHTIDCIPCKGFRPLTAAEMYMNGRPEIVRTPVYKVIRLQVRLKAPLSSHTCGHHPNKAFHIRGVLRGELFREFSLLCLRDRLVRDQEARSFGADPSGGNAMMRFLTNYVRLFVQMGTLWGGHIVFSDNSLLERTAFALTLGLVFSEMWAVSHARSLEIPVGNKPGSPYVTDREAWIRFRERRAPWSSNMSAQHSCWLTHKPDGDVDVDVVRADELAVVHGVFVGQDNVVTTRVGFDVYHAQVKQQLGKNTLCIGDWIREDPLDAEVALDTVQVDRATRTHSQWLELVDGEMEIGCRSSTQTFES